MSKSSKKKASVRQRDEGDEDEGHSIRDISGSREEDDSRLAQYIDQLSDKKGATREKALAGILSLLQSGEKSVSECRRYIETLTDELEKLLKKRGVPEKEGILSTQVLSVVALMKGAGESSFVKVFEPYLVQIITRSSQQQLRVHAIQALGLLTLICAGEESDGRVWNFCQDVLTGRSEALAAENVLQVEAGRVWCLLATIMPPETVLRHSQMGVFEACAELLNDSDLEVRLIAGECLAVLWEIACASKEYEERVSGGGSTADAEESGQLLCEDAEIVAQSLDKLRDLATDSSRRVSKKDKKEQRAAFRLLEDWVVRGEKPSESVRMQGAVVQLDSFARIVTVGTIRMLLADGFHSALCVFPVLIDILEIDELIDDIDGSDQIEKVEKSSILSRQRSLDRRQDRQRREACKGHYEFSMDEEDGF